MSIASRCIALSKALNVVFTLNDSPILFSDVFSDRGMFPGIVKRANELASLCLGYDIGGKIEGEENAMLGKKVSFDEVTPDSLRLLFIADILFELIESASDKYDSEGNKLVPLDELVYD